MGLFALMGRLWGGGSVETPAEPSYQGRNGQGFRDREVTVTIPTGAYSGTPQLLVREDAGNGFFWSDQAGAASVLFEFEFATRMTEISIRQSATTTQGFWQMAGSNNGTDWTDLGDPWEWTGLLAVGAWVNISAYTKYRLTKTSGSTSNNPYQQAAYFKVSP